MKKLILIPLLLFSIIQLTRAQKISLTYKLKSADSLYVIIDKAFADEKIQRKFDKIFSKDILGRNIVSIEDNINRRFDRVNFKNTNYFVRQLNEGYFNLYELKVDGKPLYFVCSKKDTVILEQNDTIVDQSIIKDRKYNNQLVLLCKEYPELWKEASTANFQKQDIQNIVSSLNNKYGGNNIRRTLRSRFDYWGFTLKGASMDGKSDIMLDILKTNYFVNLSSIFSIRYGFRATLFHQEDYYETIKAKTLEIPVSVHFENTNSIITPYCYMGLSPTLAFSENTWAFIGIKNNTSKLMLNVFRAFGVKLKPTNSFNILTEFRYDYTVGYNLMFGIEYFLKL